MREVFRLVPTGSRPVPKKVPTTSSQFPLSKRGTGTGGDSGVNHG